MITVFGIVQRTQFQIPASPLIKWDLDSEWITNHLFALISSFAKWRYEALYFNNYIYIIHSKLYIFSMFYIYMYFNNYIYIIHSKLYIYISGTETGREWVLNILKIILLSMYNINGAHLWIIGLRSHFYVLLIVFSKLSKMYMNKG